jgi:uncharacterized protein YegL
MSNSDLQKWQDATNGINAVGQTNLSQAEWSALVVLNGSLNSGNFSSADSKNSLALLKQNLPLHAGSPALQAHLQNFIALCNKYGGATTPTVPETKEKQSVSLKSILLGAKGALSKNLKFAVIYLLAGLVVAWLINKLCALQSTNLPGYAITVIIGALASFTLLKKNQNGRVREQIAFLGAAVAAIWVYSVRGGIISGGYAFAYTFLAVGLVLTFFDKNKPNWLLWLAEVVPAVLLLLAFERLGGAVSGFGTKEIVNGDFISGRYVGAFKIFLWFLLFQSFANNAVVAQYRKRIKSKLNVLLYALPTVIVAGLLFCVFANPFKLPIFDTLKSDLIAFSQPVRADADVFDKDGNKTGIAKVTPRTSPLLSKHIPGYLASACEFSYNGDFDKANITFKYDAGLGNAGDSLHFRPRIYYFNESDGTLEELPNQTVVNNYEGWASVSAMTEHFSTYILLNSVDYNKVWTTEIRKPQTSDECSCGNTTTDGNGNFDNFDVVLVIDESGSMSQNDPNNLRVEAAKQFIDMLEADSKNNRVAIYGFENRARGILGLTVLNNKEAVKTSLNTIHAGGGTNIYSGLRAALDEIKANNISSYSPAIILMTDGQDNSNIKNYTDLIADANAKGVTVFAIGLGQVDETLLRQICDQTGGGVYYYAPNADVLPFIFKSANAAIVDYVKDSNGDGISDYYAELLNNGTLRLSNGSKQFAGIDWVNCDKDLDGDGLLNGEELIVKEQIINGITQVFVYMKSDPTDKSSKENNSQIEISKERMAGFADATYNRDLYGKENNHNIGFCDWKLTYTHQEGEWDALNTDFWYQIYENGDYAVIAFRGTPALNVFNPNIYGNWTETLSLVFNGKHPQDKKVEIQVKEGKIKSLLENNKKILITGHSLGGHLAMVCYKHILASRDNFGNSKYGHLVEKIETFNAVGITSIDAIFIKKYGDTNKITNHYTCCDIARWISVKNKLEFPGSNPQTTISHNHSTERGKASWWDWLTLSVSYWTYEKTEELSIGINAHGREHFNPCSITIFNGYFDGTYTYISKEDLTDFVTGLNIAIRDRANAMADEKALESMQDGLLLLGSTVTAACITKGAVGAAVGSVIPGAGTATGAAAGVVYGTLEAIGIYVIAKAIDWAMTTWDNIDFGIKSLQAINASSVLQQNPSIQYFRFKGKKLKSGVELEPYQ